MNEAEFLEVCADFRLGYLITEQPHPLTTGLAERAQNNLADAIAAFHQVDCNAVQAVHGRLAQLEQLVDALRECRSGGGRIFLCGCGATGRLALALEAIGRSDFLPLGEKNAIISFMAGGDAALIRSIESFEDHPEYGVRQLLELGFNHNDLLIAITEGGETPFVIGACMEAATISNRAPWFLYCNPTELLSRSLQRCRSVLGHPRIHSFCLEVGPMALAGSTRLQACTVQMLVLGAALYACFTGACPRHLIARFEQRLRDLPVQQLAPFIRTEAQHYIQDRSILYSTDAYAITVLTDTTERSPTFSLPPFENREAASDPRSACYLCLPAATDAPNAWHSLLGGRSPRALHWPDFASRASLQVLHGYDISAAAPGWLRTRHPSQLYPVYSVSSPGPCIGFAEHRFDLAAHPEPVLIQHLLLKICLNLQSTLAMGIFGRYASNLMTWVRPSNYKLIDRAARLLQLRHQQQHHSALPYHSAVREVFQSLG